MGLWSLSSKENHNSIWKAVVLIILSLPLLEPPPAWTLAVAVDCYFGKSLVKEPTLVLFTKLVAKPYTNRRRSLHSMSKANNNRKYAAYLARQFYTGQKSIRLIEDEYPFSESDQDLKNLIRLLMKTPKRKRLFKVSNAKYEDYVSNVYNLIEGLER